MLSTSLIWRTAPALQHSQVVHSILQSSFHRGVNVVRRHHGFDSFRATLHDGDNAYDTVPTPDFTTTSDNDYHDGQNVEDGIDPFEECWKSTSWTVHCHDNEQVNEIVRCFNSPAPPVYYALQRALQLSKNDIKERHGEEYWEAAQASAVEIFQVFSYLLKSGYRFAIRTNRKFFDGGSPDLEWRILSLDDDSLLPDGWRFVDDNNGDFQHTLEIARKCQEIAVEASDKRVNVDLEEINSLVDLAMKRLQWTLGLDIRGRSSADAAFCFAMAGIKNPKLYEIMATISFHELKRIGLRPSFPTTYILHIVEKLAASGITGKEIEKVYRLAGECLKLKEEHADIADSLLGKDGIAFGLHSDRPLLWLWRFATRQSKVKPPEKLGTPKSSSPGRDVPCAPIEWIEEFSDPHRPLIVDVGSGMGLSILGLATLEGGDSLSLPGTHIDKLKYADCNFLGVDLSELLVGYSQSIVERWQIGDYVQFVCTSAESLLQEIQLYPGSVALIMIQFPTPFQLPNKAGVGNSQLPDDLASGFMASASLLDHVVTVLRHSGGNLLLQSNCEDVAITMKNICICKGMTCLDASSPVTNLEDEGTSPDLPQRTQSWIQLGGERAIGPGWSSMQLLPGRGRTETEVACTLQGTTVHRCILKAS